LGEQAQRRLSWLRRLEANFLAAPSGKAERSVYSLQLKAESKSPSGLRTNNYVGCYKLKFQCFQVQPASGLVGFWFLNPRISSAVNHITTSGRSIC
ncbi:MAG: hypothetical protein ACWA6U_18390, partial [Breznakibacter sp.]